MRESRQKLNSIDNENAFSVIANSLWLNYIYNIIFSSAKIANHIVCGQSVFLHCSDGKNKKIKIKKIKNWKKKLKNNLKNNLGWDRTAQLTALSMIFLDPYFRTMNGFEILIEREWTSSGHQFARRNGHDRSNTGKIYDHNDDQRSPIFLQFIDTVWQISHVKKKKNLKKKNVKIIFFKNRFFHLLLNLMKNFLNSLWTTLFLVFMEPFCTIQRRRE